jgi:hypothetical protein
MSMAGSLAQTMAGKTKENDTSRMCPGQEKNGKSGAAKGQITVAAE